jgi:hypothetical protein
MRVYTSHPKWRDLHLLNQPQPGCPILDALLRQGWDLTNLARQYVVRTIVIQSFAKDRFTSHNRGCPIVDA